MAGLDRRTGRGQRLQDTAGMRKAGVARTSQAGDRTARKPRLALAAAALVVLMAGLTTAWAAPTAGARTVPRGLWDDTFVGVSQAKQNAILHEIADQLHIGYVRLMAFWARAEPQQGAFDDDYLATVKQAVTAARAHGLKVIIATYETPEWAQDESLWKHPPGGFKAHTTYPFYAPRANAIPEYGAFARHIAEYFKGQVFAYECWNEANIMWFFYPQQIPGDKRFGVRTYLAMLRQFYSGIKAGDPAAKVLGGNTASAGFDDRNRTSPLTWARWLKKNGVLKYCDAYSHHPYAVGTTGTKPPVTPPTFPKDTVTLGNIRDLLRIFPKTSFYLTEYGYNSRNSTLFGGGGVGERKEADYLTRAYRLVARYPQIKLLMWYLRVDVKAGHDQFQPEMYTGLRRPNGRKKPAWFAFARLGHTH
jgi:hypothetical protein